jgi:hypothetical protein
MKLSSVLAKISGPTEKTASASAPVATGEKSATAQTEDRLKAALAEATAPQPATDKTASAGSPIADVTKLASEVLGAEHEALVKEAQLYGASVCDGFMVRLATYDAAAEKIASQQLGTVTALQPGQPMKTASDDSFEKFASENPALVKEAAELGYDRTILQMDKLAEVAYRKGYDQGVGAIYKTAHQSFSAGYEDTLRLVQELRA